MACNLLNTVRDFGIIVIAIVVIIAIFQNHETIRNQEINREQADNRGNATLACLTRLIVDIDEDIEAIAQANNISRNGESDAIHIEVNSTMIDFGNVTFTIPPVENCRSS
jgi:hypothetical protein